MTLLPCRAVLFDCDGVLVDSDASVLAAWSRWARELDLDPDAVIGVVHGRRSADTVAELVAAPRRAAAAELIDRFEVEDAASVTADRGCGRVVECCAALGSRHVRAPRTRRGAGCAPRGSPCPRCS